jgi:hypothetical protein
LATAEGGNTAVGGADINFLRQAGVPVLDIRQDLSAYFNVHHSAEDTIDQIAPANLRVLTAAYATVAYIAADTDWDFRAPSQIAEGMATAN